MEAPSSNKREMKREKRCTELRREKKKKEKRKEKKEKKKKEKKRTGRDVCLTLSTSSRYF